MKEKPVLFSEEMVKVILKGEKTQTSRVVKLPSWSTKDWADFEIDEQGKPLIICADTGCLAEIPCPYGQAGDRLWVREKFTLECPYEHADGCGNPEHVIYWVSQSQVVRDSITSRWRPSIHMPRWASRLNLEVTEVRVEQVQAISAGDVIDEGVGEVNWLWEGKGDDLVIPAKFVDAFRELGWDMNPWVWVVEFEREMEDNDVR